jgi:serine/threonine-protein kinase HipA
MGQHRMDICGHGQKIERAHLLQLASQGGLSQTFAKRTIESVLQQVPGFRQRAQEFPIRQVTIDHVAQCIESCARMLCAD